MFWEKYKDAKCCVRIENMYTDYLLRKDKAKDKLIYLANFIFVNEYLSKAILFMVLYLKNIVMMMEWYYRIYQAVCSPKWGWCNYYNYANDLKMLIILYC